MRAILEVRINKKQESIEGKVVRFTNRLLAPSVLASSCMQLMGCIAA